MPPGQSGQRDSLHLGPEPPTGREAQGGSRSRTRGLRPQLQKGDDSPLPGGSCVDATGCDRAQGPDAGSPPLVRSDIPPHTIFRESAQLVAKFSQNPEGHKNIISKPGSPGLGAGQGGSG